MGRYRIALSVAFGLIFASSSFAADTVPPREAREAGYRYLVFETAGAKPEQTLPMIVGLHYSSAKPEAMLEYFDTLDFPARIVLPQGEYPRRDGYSWFPTDYAQRGQTEQDAAAFATEKKLAVFIEDVRKRYPTRGKPAVMGISYGGDVSFLLAIRHPETVSAAFPIAARFLPTWMPAANTCKPHCPPIRAMHGDADTTVPMKPTRAAAMKLKTLGYDVALTPYPGVTHDFDARMERDFVGQAKKALAAP